mgnify:CR=1 FL=1
MPNIEVEYYSLISPEKHEELNQFLMKNADDLGEDNKETYYFLLHEKTFKVVNNVSNNTAKIVLKIGRIGKENFFDETEVPISPDDYDNTVKIFKEILDCQVIKSYQDRHNFSYKGVDISVKYSNEWGHHVELEILISDLKDKDEADKKIFEIAAELELKVLTVDEAKALTDKIERGNRKNI